MQTFPTTACSLRASFREHAGVQMFSYTPPTDQHNAHIFTEVFSITVVVSVLIVSQCP